MKSLARDTLVYGLAAMLSRGLALLVLPVYTHVLSPRDYGALDMILVIGNLAVLVVPLEISQALARLFNDPAGPDARRLMSSTALWFTITAFSLAFFVAVIAAPVVAETLLGSRAMANVFRLGAAFIAVNGIFYFLQSQLRFELRSRDYAILSSVYAALTLVFGVVFGFVLRLGLPGIITAQLLAALTSVAVGLSQLRRSYALIFDRKVLASLLSFSFPLVPSGLATFLTLYGNRLLLNALIGLGAVGLFGVAVRIANIVTLPILGFQSALTPLIYAHYREVETPVRLARIFEGFIAVAMGGCLMLGLFAREILGLVAEPKYTAAAPFIMVLAPATILSQAYIFFPGIALARKTHLQLLIFILSATASLGANWLLIGSYGLMGAALATLLSAFLFMGVWSWTSQRLYPLPIAWIRLAAIGVAFVATATAGLVLQFANFPAGASFGLRILVLAAFVASAFATGLFRVAEMRALIQRRRRRESEGESIALPRVNPGEPS